MRGSTSTNNYGIRVTGGSLVQSGSGPLQVTGRGGASTGSGNAGVFVEAVGSRISSAGGNVQVTGFGGGAGLRFPMGSAALFAEARYMSVKAFDTTLPFIPIIVGVSFGGGAKQD